MPRRSATIWLVAAAAFAVYAALVAALPQLLGVGGTRAWVLRGVLWALGLVTTIVAGWMLQRRAKAAPAQPSEDATALAETDEAAWAARRRLAAARIGGGRLGALPVVLVLGPSGAAKSTMLTRSALDPELLAGDAGSDRVVPTRLVNLWYAGDAVFAEVGGAASARVRARLLRALRPRSARAAVGAGTQAPRLAVVCFPCDELLKPGAGDAVPAAARALRAELAEAAAAFGVRLPVYVLFTKLDRVTGFAEFVQTLTRDEVREVLGATLPATDPTDVAGRAEHQAARLTEAFETLFRSLAARRLTVLLREQAMARRPAAYEFPRELRKLAPLAAQFLAELDRPSQLAVSPFVRGFYFAGVRAIVVSDGADAQPAAYASEPPAGGSATRVFGARSASATGVHALGGSGARSSPARAPGAARKTPQWVFLDRVFPEVVLADVAARQATRSGTRVHGLRRAALAAAALLALVIGIGTTASFVGNRGLARSAAEQARAVAALPVVSPPPGTVALPSTGALRALDALRGTLDTLAGYERDGAPRRLRWGLWYGDDVRTAALPVWRRGYEAQLHADAWQALVDSLQALPPDPRPDDDYGRIYDRLRAYLATTAEPQRSTPDVVAPVLLASWQRGHPVDAEALALARAQFAFHAAERARTPVPGPADAQLVGRTRDYLRRFGDAERMYGAMLADAARAPACAEPSGAPPQTAGVVAAPPAVPCAFTRPGWEAMQRAFADPDRFFRGEPWVLGDATAARLGSHAGTIDALRRRYADEYAARWREYVTRLAVPAPGDLADAARRLEVLGGAQSPLLAQLALVARHTTVDAATAAAFQPVRTVAPDTGSVLITESNTPYVQALGALQAGIEPLATIPPPADSAGWQAYTASARDALRSAASARDQARAVTRTVELDPATADVAAPVAALLLAPFSHAEALLGAAARVRAPAGRVAAGGAGGAPRATLAASEVAALNARAARLCEAMKPVQAKFPFAPDATAEATLAEVSQLLSPASGELWSFHREWLDRLLVQQGGRWVARSDAPVAPSERFVAFFDHMARASTALYPDGGAQPRVGVRVRGFATSSLPRVEVRHGAQTAAFASNSPAAELAWPAASGREASIRVRRDRTLRPDDSPTVANARGDWALFRLAASAPRRSDAAGGAVRAEWDVRGAGPVAVEFGVADGVPLLKRGWLGEVGCVGQVTR